ncbi:hypothetical protein EYA84_00745 [Verrucosispora sp. SN26_14.1]|uniref:hypothetical protein n=1 Tax=Verrucosispora sp. SN26_14.1 TaxID=2527879 RepID=UPI001034A597|nr:hypothetical protein [Verrucosispora sp. SN26_14.1]TBL45340.1 hypothetical protein EYA84_00745 [Verrucosispora sp. SN26_14.1]
MAATRCGTDNQGDVCGRIGDGDAVRIADDMNDDENWTGGFYELCLVLGASDDATVGRALSCLWRAADVQGCHRLRGDGTGFAAVDLGVVALHEHGHVRGTLTLPSGARVVCGAFLSRYEGTDTLELYLPLGALAPVDRRVGGYPFDESSGVESSTWRSPLDRWLADIAIAVHGEVPFHRALIGFEVHEDHGNNGDQRYHAILTPSPDGIEYRPAST